jgi:hypothetical protein
MFEGIAAPSGGPLKLVEGPAIALQRLSIEIARLVPLRGTHNLQFDHLNPARIRLPFAPATELLPLSWV